MSLIKFLSVLATYIRGRKRVWPVIRASFVAQKRRFPGLWPVFWGVLYDSVKKVLHIKIDQMV
jgi:hypothetical protein